MRNRLWEIDSIRGLAILLMIVYHFVYNLAVFYQFPIAYTQGFWFYIARTAAITFMLTAGVSSTFSKNNVRRGRSVFLYGLIITAATYLFDPQAYIKFGILHFMGTSMMLYFFLQKQHPGLLIVLGAVIIALGPAVQIIQTVNPYLFPLGLTAPGFVSADFYPLIPWFGVFLWGAALGKLFYKDKKSLLPFRPRHRFLPVLGRYSLYIYLLHQPILLGLLSVIMSQPPLPS